MIKYYWVEINASRIKAEMFCFGKILEGEKG